MRNTDDLRVKSLRPLLPPAILAEEIPLRDGEAQQVLDAREAVRAVLDGRDDRLLVVVGPCSIHDPEAALEYGERLRAEAARHAGDLLVVMRVYFEKPRTTIGWKGLINDPHLDNTFAINTGLRTARRLLVDLLRLGMPSGTEFLETITPQFISDVVVWGAIGARTTESQVHRQLASGLSMPVGFKNGTRGTVQIAVDAVRSASHPHRFLGVTKQGLAAIVETSGNPDCHVILRGGSQGPNYDEAHVADATARLASAGLRPRIMVDCSHANSGKDPERQPVAAAEVARQLSEGSDRIFGVMLESFLVGGRQDHRTDGPLVRGQSITDACLAWDETVPVLDALAGAVRARRAIS